MADFIVGGATLNQTPLQWGGNIENICAAISHAKQQSINLLCLPELAITGYGCEDLFLSEWVPDKACELLQSIIPETAGIAIAVGLPVRFNNHTYNAVALLQNEKILGIVPKQNLAIDGVHYENRWFTAWTSGEDATLEFGGLEIPFGDLIFTIDGYRVGFEICEDAWRSQRPADNHAKKGIDIILNPSASHFALHKYQDREELVRSSARKYDCVYIYANLLGNEAGKMIYDGDILISENGVLKARNQTLSFNPWQVVSYNMTSSSEQSIPASWDKNTEFGRAVALALFDYLRKSKTKGFIVSLSGGADSATCATLVYQMVLYGVSELGTDEFLREIHQPELGMKPMGVQEITKALLSCAYQATRNSSKATRNAAYSLADSIGATFYEWSIDDVVHSYTEKIEQAIQEDLTWEKDDITLQNIQARARSPIIWMLANKKNSLLLVTSNRSEGDVGYATMDGDTSGSLAPIAGIDKPFIRQWLKWAEIELDIPGLHFTNQLVPTAELRPSDKHQTDEDDLMPYELLVAIERLAIRDHLSPVAVYNELRSQSMDSEELKNYIVRFFQLWSINQWKRERTAPSFHLDDFNVDPRTWCRFPILSSNFKSELDELKKQT